jgi:protein gp37
LKTDIEWATDVWNPIVGCSKVSPGCANCYAERMANRLAHNPATPEYADTIRDGRWSGKLVVIDDKWDDPLRWRKPRRVFVNSMSDLFHKDVPLWYIITLFDVMRIAERHTFMILTKRAERMAEVMRSIPPPPNVWLGVSVEDQERANERIPLLLQTPAAVRFVSCEPLLGPVNIVPFLQQTVEFPESSSGVLHWMIVGGESGPRARPMHPDWARALRDQCTAAGVPFFFKSWGEWALKGSTDAKCTGYGVLSPDGQWYDGHTGWNGRPIDRDTGEAYMLRVGKHAAGRMLDGRERNEYPEMPA